MNDHSARRSVWKTAIAASSFLAIVLVSPVAARAVSFAPTIDQVQPRIVKIYGAGGLRGLEAYQSGFLISADGHILTTFSYVLDTDYLKLTLDDGRRFDARLVGVDPRLEIAVLKVEAEDLPHFDLAAAVTARAGDRVLAFSNLYGVAAGDEPASVQRGVIAAVTELAARRGVFETPYRGTVYVVDAVTNNPGATGGALTNIRGELIGMLGKELKNARDNTWLNYAIPIAELRPAVEDIQAGKFRRRDPEDARQAKKPLDLARIGVVLVPNVIDSTPPYIDSVLPGSIAAEAGVQPDDLIIFVNEALVQSLRDIREQCKLLERNREVLLTVRRGQELKTITLMPPEDAP